MITDCMEKVEIYNFTYKYIKENYNYLYLKSRFENINKDKKIIITGSSHGLMGIDNYELDSNKIINCCMHSQDLYYNLQCILKILNKNASIDSCLLFAGYYIPFQDLSRGKVDEKHIISRVYYPLFKDTHNYKGEIKADILWEKMPLKSWDYKQIIEEKALKSLMERKQYVNDLHSRGKYFQFDGSWKDLTIDKKEELGKYRSSQHNKHENYAESYKENLKIMEEIKRVINNAGGKCIVVIPPFTDAYLKYFSHSLREKSSFFFNSLSDKVIDFNLYSGLFCDDDFVDTDHLNGRGGYKLSNYIKKCL